MFIREKGGTTNLRANLLTHPLVSGMPNEIHFFDQDPKRYPKLGQWPGDGRGRDLKPGVVGELLQLYSRACLEQGRSTQEGFPDPNLSMGVMVESGPRYMLCPLAPYRMKMVRPEAKLVVVLRDPAERYFSHMRMVMCKRRPDPGFHSRAEMVSGLFHLPGSAKQYLTRAETVYQPYTALCRGENATASDLWGCYSAIHRQNPLFRGLYADQLERWFRVYDPSQFFILDSAEMFANFTDAVKRVAEFAGLPAYDFRYTTGHEFKSVCETQQWPEEPDFFAPQGMYEQLKKEEPLIRDWYRPHNERLFRLLGRDFGWNS